MQLQALAQSLNRDRERRLLLERQLADLEATDSISVAAASPAPVSGRAAAGATTAEQLDEDASTDAASLHG